MLMLYNSDSFAVVQFDFGRDEARPEAPARGGYEIVDKFARKEIFLEGEVATQFKAAVDDFITAARGRLGARLVAADVELHDRETVRVVEHQHARVSLALK